MRGLRDLAWAVPWACLALVAAVMLRPEPVIPPLPAHGRTVTDLDGARVDVPLKVRAVYYGAVTWFLEMTHAPGALAWAGDSKEPAAYARGIMGRVYPQLAGDGALWRPQGRTMERFLADDRGYVYFVFDTGPLRRWGLTAVRWLTNKGKLDKATVPGWGDMELAGWDAEVINGTRVINSALGQDALGARLVADYTEGYRSLAADLRPATLESRPRVLNLLCSKEDWSRVLVLGERNKDGDSVEDRRTGVRNAAAGLRNAGRQQEAERVLAMDPDIVVASEPVEDFLRDPRWRGLKAVRERRVYNGPARDFAGSEGTLLGLTYNPLWARWTAEIAHPERMPGGLRERLRAHLQTLYGYRLSEAEIDELLNVEKNRGSAGYDRFRAGGVAEAAR